MADEEAAFFCGCDLATKFRHGRTCYGHPRL